MYKSIIEKFNIQNGTEISIETGKLAKQADGSVVVNRDTMLATVVAKKK